MGQCDITSNWYLFNFSHSHSEREGAKGIAFEVTWSYQVAYNESVIEIAIKINYNFYNAVSSVKGFFLENIPGNLYI